MMPSTKRETIIPNPKDSNQNSIYIPSNKSQDKNNIKETQRNEIKVLQNSKKSNLKVYYTPKISTIDTSTTIKKQNKNEELNEKSYQTFSPPHVKNEIPPTRKKNDLPKVLDYTNDSPSNGIVTPKNNTSSVFVPGLNTTPPKEQLQKETFNDNESRPPSKIPISNTPNNSKSEIKVLQNKTNTPRKPVYTPPPVKKESPKPNIPEKKSGWFQNIFDRGVNAIIGDDDDETDNHPKNIPNTNINDKIQEKKKFKKNKKE